MPFLTRAMGDAPGALEWLQGQLGDEPTRFMCERLLATAAPGGLGGLEHEPWMDLVERLIFVPWSEGAGGWVPRSPRAGYAGDWDEALHLALMMELPDYPYANAREARAVRDAFRLKPRGDQGLASLMVGAWEPMPEFPPDRIFSTQGRGGFVPREGLAFADWAWRPERAVVNWHAEPAAQAGAADQPGAGAAEAALPAGARRAAGVLDGQGLTAASAGGGLLRAGASGSELAPGAGRHRQPRARGARRSTRRSSPW